MSWIPEAIVISGYRIPRLLWEEGMAYCDTNPTIFEDWDDFFIDMDQPGDKQDETFFGAIIYHVGESTPAIEFNTILADRDTITRVQNAFHAIFDHIYKMRRYPVPSYNQYLGCRWT